MRPKTISINPLALDIDAFATKQAPAAGGFIIFTSGAAQSEDTDVNAFCEAQTPTAAGALTMDGVQADKQLTYPRVITITCTSDISADTYTLYGWTASEPGRTQTESLSGPNASTVRSTKVFGKIYAVETDTAATSVVEIGQMAIGLPTEPVRPQFSASLDESGVTYTLYGIDQYGRYKTETGLLPTTGGTVLALDTYSAIIGVSLSSAVATTISVGISNKVESPWYQVDRNSDVLSVNVTLSSSADMAYTIQWTDEDIHATTFTAARSTPTSAYVHSASALGVTQVGGTVSDASAYAVFIKPVSAVRVAIENFASGSADIRILDKRNI